MKVPNKVLEIVERYTNEDVIAISETDRVLVRTWVLEGKAKRATLAAEAKVGGVGSEGAP